MARLKSLALVAMLVHAGCTWAQLTPVDPDWKETDVPAPPALRVDNLVPVDMPNSALRWGVDPSSISIGPDGVVRYVVVARSDSAVNAMYEGLRCGTGDVRLYARNTGSRWVPVDNSQWVRAAGNRSHAHSLLIARSGACPGSGSPTPQDIARELGRATDPQSRHIIR